MKRYWSIRVNQGSCDTFSSSSSSSSSKVHKVVVRRKHSRHYANTLMQHTAIFHGCKNVHFQMKLFKFFLIFAQNIDCGYTL